MKHFTESQKFLIAGLLMFIPLVSIGQTVLGTWQLTKSTNCIESELETETQTENDLAADMKKMSSPAAEIIRFREKGAGEESTRILNKRKTANGKNFLYKVNGETLLILDKRSQTIAETYNIDKLSADSLILSNATRSCDIKFFVKIKDPR
jgi:hypothetical protein